MPFAFFDHTGDIGVRLDEATPDGLFSAGAAAFTASITDPASVRPRDTRSLALDSSDLDLLLVDFLDEILYLFDVHQFLVADAEVRLEPFGDPATVAAGPSHAAAGDPDVRGASAWRLHATLTGERFDASHHGVKVLIKAITYHALDVGHDERGWHATIVFDI